MALPLRSGRRRACARRRRLFVEQLEDRRLLAEVGANDFRISNQGTDGSTGFTAGEPAVAYNSAANEYLVVWRGDVDGGAASDSEIFGQRLNAATGARIGGNFQISTTGTVGNTSQQALDPEVVFNPTDNEYLVVWAAFDTLPGQTNIETEIFGQRLTATGIETGTDDFRISDMGNDGNGSFGALFPSVCYVLPHNEYLVVWEGSDPIPGGSSREDEIWGQRLDAQGSEIGDNDFRISQAGSEGDQNSSAGKPAVVFNESSHEFLVVWEAFAPLPGLGTREREIYGQRLSMFGGVIAGADEFRISSMGPDGSDIYEAFRPEVAHNSTNNQYLVVWRGDDDTAPLVDGEFEVFGQRLTATGAATGADDFRISDMGPDGNASFDVGTSSQSSIGVTYAPSKNEYLVVWSGDGNTPPLVDNEQEVFGQRLNAQTGQEVGTNDFRLSDMGGSGSVFFAGLEPVAAWNAINSEYLTVWSGDDNIAPLADQEFEIFGQRSLAQAACDVVVTTAADSANSSDPVNSLREAITCANVEADNSSISFDIPNMPTDAAVWFKAEGNANDSTGGNVGQPNGNVNANAAGKVGQAFAFDGNGDFVRVPASPSLNVGQAPGLTIEAWINPTTVAASQPIVEWNSGSSTAFGTHFWIHFQAGMLFGNLVDTTGTPHQFNSPAGILTAGTFQHVALTYDKASGMARLYRNGLVVAEAGLGAFTPQTSTDLYIGHRPGAQHYTGLMDEVSIFSRALSGPEVHAIFQSDSAGKALNRPGLASWYRAEDNATDAANNPTDGSHGTLQNGATFAAGQTGRAFSFDGVDDVVRLPNSAALQPQRLSLEAWTFPTGLGTGNDIEGPVIISKDNTAGVGVSYGIFGPGSTGKYQAAMKFTDGTYTVIRSTNLFTLNQWHHTSLTWDGNTLSLYVDGNLEASQIVGAKTIEYSTEDAGIGRHIGFFQNRAFQGQIDEVGIYDRTLSASEVRGSFAAGGAHKAPTGVMTIAPTGITHLAQVGDFFFNPPNRTINVGDTIEWTWVGNFPHSVTSNTGEFDSGVTSTTGFKFRHTFNTAGVFPYRCVIHPSSMTGTITVVAGGTTPALPAITQSVIIDGYSQPGAAANAQTTGSDAVLRVELNGAGAGPGVDGLSISGPAFGTGSTIRGLAINRYAGDGIDVASGNNRLEGNAIGTDAAGLVDLGNGGHGIAINNSSASTIGGTTPAARNIISGNTGSGVFITGQQAQGNLIRGNLIGASANLTGLSNTSHGVLAQASGPNEVGGTAAGAGNLIAFNTGAGVAVVSPPSFFKPIIGNSIHSNVGLGIDLENDGPTANDDDDPDSGANGLQNFPVISSVTEVSGNTQIQGTLNSIPSRTYRIELFSNDAKDPSNFGEGQTYLGFVNTATDANGDASFTFTATGVILPGKFITATATRLNGGFPDETSEFSRAFTVASAQPELSINDPVAVVEGHSGTTDLVFTVTLSQAPTQPVTVDFATADNTAKALVVNRIAGSLARPVFVTAPPGDMNRLFILEQHQGRIRIFDRTTSTLLSTPFLTIPGGVSTGNEQGLLGMAFHPNYATNGSFYVSYTDLSGQTQIRRFTRSAGDANQADITTEQPVLSFARPQTNHNGGWIGFGPDGKLYISSGDGGGANDTGSGHTPGIGNAQDKTNLLGKILRIDVDGDDFDGDSTKNYSIPPSNPFAGATEGADEIWSYGLRNPFRPSFDRVTGDLWIADVGQTAREEIDFQPASSPGGENYGWRAREGTIATPAAGIGIDPKPAGMIDPIYDYGRGSDPALFQGTVVTGGYVYRGPIPELAGQYFFADAASEGIWSIRFTGGDPATFNGTQFSDRTDWTRLFNPSTGNRVINSISSFGEDAAGNLFIADLFGGEIYQVTNGADYDQHSGQLTFNPGGPLTQTITVKVIGDRVDELNETFFVNLSNVQGPATIADSQGQGTIQDDDARPTLSVTGGSVLEGDEEMDHREVPFTISLDAISGRDIGGTLAVSGNGSAELDVDFHDISGQPFVIPAGTKQIVIHVPVIADTDVEGDETFTLTATVTDTTTISNNSGSASGSGTILNDDVSGGCSTIVINTNDSGPGSLRAAIDCSNSTPGFRDTISFNIPGGGVHTIAPASELPFLFDDVEIDGYTQPGTNANTSTTGFNGTLRIELSGANAGPASGLVVFSNIGTTIKGLVINRFTLGFGGIYSLGSSGLRVEGNVIGANPAGTTALANTRGVYVAESSNSVIGGTTLAARNVISGNSGSGILVLGNNSAAVNLLVQGNLIGTQASGTSALGNAFDGVSLVNVSGVTIGGTASGAGNRIAFNMLDGVSVDPDSASSPILGNSIFQNGDLGIDLGADHLTANDQGDSDTGANNLQNFPVITSAEAVSGNTQIHGTLNSVASKAYRIELFASDFQDSSTFGEGQTYLGSTEANTDANGDASFEFHATSPIPAGKFITATASPVSGGLPIETSEFSGAFAIPCSTIVTNTNDTGDGSLRAAITCANSNVGVIDTISFNIPGSGVHTISPTSALPEITDPIIIDGYTQPGAISNSAPSGFNGTLQIELNGVNAPDANGLTISAGGSLVRGLVINRFSLHGIVLHTGGGNVIQENFIGADVTGTINLGNAQNGVQITNSSNNTIGGMASGSSAGVGNLLSGNGAAGVFVESGTRNSILSNSIRDNAGLGIDLNPVGNNRNDLTPTQDADAGPNNLQNSPLLVGARILSGNRLAVVYRVPSAPTNAPYPIRVQFFVADADGQEGQIFLGDDLYEATEFGTSPQIVFQPLVAVATGAKIIATATDDFGIGNTSEFSPSVEVANPWHNILRPLDVRGGSSIEPDNFVDAGDALAIINYINTFGSTPVPEDAQLGLPHGFLDTNNDDSVAADDALSIINAVNSGLGGEGESRPMAPIGQARQVSVQSSTDLENLLALLALDNATLTTRRRK